MTTKELYSIYWVDNGGRRRFEHLLASGFVDAFNQAEKHIYGFGQITSITHVEPKFAKGVKITIGL